MTAATGVKVTVVVPVYNPGENIESLIQSLADQSLPPDEYEVVFVDDGSTDDTPARLERACALHPQMRMTTIPNSGWPGRPRNVGTDLAEGEYVFYADNDDELYPEALERMYAMAAANGSDIVYGKVVRTGRSTPYWSLWQRNVGVADPVADHVVRSRTVHKLYRRQFLLDHSIRFPEGRVRLEDFNFMGQAIPRAQVISILADYPCYRWIHRTDGTNNSTAAVSQARYWGYAAEALELMAAGAGEGELLDDARVTAVEQAFSRFAPSGYLASTPAKQQSQFDAVRDFLRREVPDHLDQRLPVLKRLRVHALRDGDKPRFDALQKLRTELSFEVRATEVRWQDGALHVVAEARMHGTNAVTVLEPGDDGELRLAVPDLARPDPASRVLLPQDRGTLELTVRRKDTGLEWPVASAAQLGTERRGDGVTLTARVEAVIDPEQGCFGQALDDGQWDLLARLQFLGEGTSGTLHAPATGATGRAAAGNRTVRWNVSKQGRLTLRLGYEAVTGRRTATRVVDVKWPDGRLQLTVDPPPRTRAQVMLRHRVGGDGTAASVHDGRATLVLTGVRENQIVDAYLRLESPGAVREERLLLGGPIRVPQHPSYAVLAGADRGLSLRALRHGEVPPEPLTIRERQARLTRPSAGRLFALAPPPVQRLARRLRRRWRARR
jgi:poly(ribitol-phosphate) beta-N-acetylglucosaminyltransferase